jgi:phenylacetate-CoA ligase
MIYTAVDQLRAIKRTISPRPPDAVYQEIVEDPLAAAERYRQAMDQYALEHVPYYRPYRGLETFPRLTKKVIRERFDELLSDRIDQIVDRKENTSGGSTGVPVRLVQHAEYDRFVSIAMNYYFREMLGYELGGLRKLMIWGSEKDILSWSGDWRKRLNGVLSKTKYVNSFDLSEKALEQCVATINEFRPEMIRGYASSVLALAQYIKRLNLRIHKPIFLISSAEVLKAEARQAIEEVFERKIFDFYGSRECAALAGECRSGLMHLFSFNQLVEIVDAKNQPVGVGEEGDVLVTTLHNRAMPLLRFEIGDLAVRGPAHCTCGNPLPTISRVTGRSTDNFLTREGKLVHGEYFTHLFYFRPWVKQFQVVQEDFDNVQVKVVAVDDVVPELEAQEIRDLIQRVMGSDCRVRVETLDAIPPSPQGKYLFTFSKITANPK